MGTVAPIRMRDKEREKAHGVIRGMNPMEDWAMKAHAAYDTTSPMRRLEVVPDLQGVGAITKQVPTRFGQLMREIRASDKPFAKVIEPVLELKEAFFGPSKARAQVSFGSIRDFLEQGKKLKVDIDATGGFESLTAQGKKQILGHELGHAMLDALTKDQKAQMAARGISPEDLATGFVVWVSKGKPKAGKALSPEAQKIYKAKQFIDEIWEGLGEAPAKVNRGDRVGPIVNDELLPQSRKPSVSPTAVTPFELQQMGLSKGAGSSTGGAARYRATKQTTKPAKRGKK